MKVDDRLRALAANVPNVLPTLGPPKARSRGAIVHALVMPLLAALGYELFDPREIARGGSAGEVDFAIIRDGAPVVLIEVRASLGPLTGGAGPALEQAHARTGARAAIVTDGVSYRVYADTRERGALDDKPAIIFDLRSLDAGGGVRVEELGKLGKASFDLAGLLAAARLPPRVAAISAVLTELFDRKPIGGPDPELVALIHRRVDPDGELDLGFARDVSRVLAGVHVPPGPVAGPDAVFVEPPDAAVPELVAASETTTVPIFTPVEADLTEELELDQADDDGPIVTTEEELAGYAIVRELVGDIIPLARVGYRDRRRFFGIIIDGDEHKTLCRLHFNRVRKYVGIFAGPTREKKHRVANVEAIAELREPLRAAARRWVDEEERP